MQKKGSKYTFLFPSKPVDTNPAGVITIGNTITVLYALSIVHGKARFIGVDGTKLSASTLARIKMAVHSAQSDKNFGFMIRDSQQPTLDITINPSFMAEVKNNVNKLQEKMARQGNLNITLAPASSGIKIVSVILD